MALYLIDPENEAYLRGAAERPSSIPRPSGCGVLFALLFVVVGLLPLGFGLNMLRENLLLSSSSISAQARISDRYIEEDEDGDRHYVVFDYVANDQRYTQTQRIDEGEYSRYEQGMTVAIEYSSSDVTVARLAGTNSWGFTAFLLVFAALWMLFSLGFTVGMLNENKRRKALLRGGQRLNGELISLSVDEDTEDTYTIVKVRFRTPSARMIENERRYNTSRGKLQPPPASASVAIFYMDDEHWEVL